MTAGTPAPRAVVIGFPGYRELHLWYPVLRLREEGWQVTIAAPGEPRQCAGALGYPLIPEADLAAIPPEDVRLAVVPGGPGAADAAADAALTGFVRRVSERGAVLGAVAEGSAVLAAAAAWNVSSGLDGDLAERDLTERDRVVVARDSDALPALVRALLRLTDGPTANKE